MAQHNRNRNQREGSRQREEKPYEEMVDIYLKNLDIGETFHFYTLMSRGDHGNAGKENGLFAAINGLREKVKVEGILEGLLTQGRQCIKNGENPGFTLAPAIAKNSERYLGSAFLLKAKDLIPYLKSRLGDVEIIAEKDYEEIQLKDLVNIDREGNLRSPRNEKEKYGLYLFEQLRNAVMARGNSLAHEEKARTDTEEYKGADNVMNLANYRRDRTEGTRQMAA
jgi:hypothetical protein